MRFRRVLRPFAALARSAYRWVDLGLGVVVGLPMLLWSRYRPIHVQVVWAARVGPLAIETELFHWRRVSVNTLICRSVNDLMCRSGSGES